MSIYNVPFMSLCCHYLVTYINRLEVVLWYRTEVSERYGGTTFSCFASEVDNERSIK